MKEVITLLMAIGLMCSCHDTKRSNNYDSNKSNNEKSISDYRIEEVQTKAVEKLYITVEVCHIIKNLDGSAYIKDANRTTTMPVTMFDDGTMTMKGRTVIYSKLDDYEYACFLGNDYFAFNEEDIIRARRDGMVERLDSTNSY